MKLAYSFKCSLEEKVINGVRHHEISEKAATSAVHEGHDLCRQLRVSADGGEGRACAGKGGGRCGGRGRTLAEAWLDGTEGERLSFSIEYD